MSAKVFLNYRRDDAKFIALSLHTRLEAEFGADNVFFDVSGEGGIPFGVNYQTYIEERVGECDVLVALIGPSWLSMLEARAQDSGRDFVRIEIEAALARGIPVIPVLAEETRMPTAGQLPESLHEFAYRNAARLRFEQFVGDAAILVNGIRRTLDLATGTAARSHRRPFAPGDVFQDGPDCPEMVVIPAGRFLMGSPTSEAGRRESEGPQHGVTLEAPFALGKYTVTFAEYDAYCASSGASRPGDEGWGRDRRPVINVSWEDAAAYCRLLSQQTRTDYRLPTEAEWEYACRAGTQTQFWFGDDDGLLSDHAWYRGNSGEKTHPVGQKPANPFGLHDMHGNVWEWVEDCWHKDYQGAPTDGAAWLAADGGDCSRSVLRGGSKFNNPGNLRSALRLRSTRDVRNGHWGFRLARTLPGQGSVTP